MYDLACLLLGIKLIGNQAIGICPGIQHHSDQFQDAPQLLELHPAGSVRGVRLLLYNIDNFHIYVKTVT